ncbi:MAG TPA: response regulator [Steroidobacteraceae bacterium]|nr:response regulator [Steroidobacteraceae bacterium]
MSEHQPIIDLIEDYGRVATDLREALISMGLRVRTHATVARYLARDDATDAGCLLCSIRLPGTTGRRLQEYLNFIGAATPVVLVGDSVDMGVAVDAIQLGVFDYLELPLDHVRLADCVQRALDYAQRQQTHLLDLICQDVQYYDDEQRLKLQGAAAAMSGDPQLNRFSDFMSELAHIRPSAAARRLH